MKIPLGSPPIAWLPHPKQALALMCPARELLYGGAAGGGKSDFLLVCALLDAGHKGYRGAIFRRNTLDLEEILTRSREIVPVAYPGAEWHEQKRTWSFPAGGVLHFWHLDDLKAALAKKSFQFNFLGFDELTLFDEAQYFALLSRARSPAGLPVKIRAATNPGGPGAAWVKARWAPWLDRTCAKRAEPGEVLWYLPDGQGAPQWVKEGTPGALSRCFIPSLLADNPSLTEADPLYATAIRDLDPLTRAQLADGDWDAVPAPRLFFRREWCGELAGGLSRDARRVRYWDRAATEPRPGADPDWTVGLLLAMEPHGTGRRWCIEDVVRGQWAPGTVADTIRRTAERDGIGVQVALNLDPGSAGVFEAHHYLQSLAPLGVAVTTHRESGDKETRIKAVSAQMQPLGGISWFMAPGVWRSDLVAELEGYPDVRHDDQWDALGGAFRVLAAGGGVPGGIGKSPASPSRVLYRDEEDDEQRERPTYGPPLRYRR